MAGPFLVKINKKTGTNTYTLYHPQTGAEMVLYNGALGLPWENLPQGVHKYTQAGDQDDSTGTYYLLSDVLAHVNAAIDDFGGVLEFKDNATVSGLPTDGNRKGEVYVVQYPATGTGHHIYWSSSGAEGSWEEYPTNTLFVCSADANKNYIKDETTAAAKAGWVPLGGTNSAYATKTEAIHSIVGDNTGLKFGYASEANATHSVAGVSTIGTTAVSTTTIVSTIPPTGSDSSIPNVAAVRAFAGSADNVIVTTTSASSDYYITFVENTGSTGQPLYVNSGLFYDPSTNELNVIASEATTATTADKVRNTFTVAGQTFDGSATKTVAIGNGLTATTNGTVTTVSVNYGDGLNLTGGKITVSAASGGGITVSSSGVRVQLVTNGAITTSASGLDLRAMTTIDADAVYSAIQVDGYGRAKAGAQSIIFASGINDPDLGDLVVGGLAFIGTSTAAASTYTGKAASKGNIGVMDDAE